MLLLSSQYEATGKIHRVRHEARVQKVFRPLSLRVEKTAEEIKRLISKGPRSPAEK